MQRYSHVPQTPQTDRAPVWHASPVGELLSYLKTRPEGLTQAEAHARTHRFGKNVLPEPPRARGPRIFLRQFKSAFTVILGLASFVSWALGDIFDAAFIVAALGLNVFFGFVQEWRAERSLSLLRGMIRNEATVVRDGMPRRIDAEELVFGDVILVSAGERVPADARLFMVESLEANEAALTGESLPVEKRVDPLPFGTVLADRRNMLFAGTAVVRGEASAVVVATGSRTELGRIAKLVREIPDELTPLEERLRGLAHWVTMSVLSLAVLILTIGIASHRPFLEVFTTASAVAVAAIPEGLVIAVTVILVVGMRRLVRKRALVRRLRAAETLGSVTVICADKTGTITEGRMRVMEVLPAGGGGDDERIQLLRIAAYANEAWLEEAPHADGHRAGGVVGESTDVAVLSAALSAGLHDEIDSRKKVIRDRILFSSENQFTAALVHPPKQGQSFVAFKGAAEKLLPASSRFKKESVSHVLSSEQRATFMRQHNALSQRGMRLLAVAEKPIVKDARELPPPNALLENLTFLGFLVLEDPPRPGVREAFADAKAAGIKTILITGDHLLTAQSIAGAVGIGGDRVVSGEELHELSDDALRELVRHDVVFARTVPQQKLRIVEMLKRNGEVVAMTGDGINDAPALKAADIGVAIGSGTEVAKSSADLVVLNDDFSTIVVAVREGRIIFENIRKVTVFLLVDTFSEIILVAGSMLLGLPLALLAAQILFVNLVEDSLPAFSLAFEKEGRGIMRRPPRSPKEPILNSEALFLIFVVGILSDILLLGIYAFLHAQGVSHDVARTVVFAAVGLNSATQIYALRNLTVPIWRMNPFSNPWLVGATVFGAFAVVTGVSWAPLQEVLRTESLSTPLWLLVIGLSLFAVLPVEFVKYLFRRPRNQARRRNASAYHE